MHIHIYYTVGGLKINNQLYLGYSKREALKQKGGKVYNW